MDLIPLSFSINEELNFEGFPAGITFLINEVANMWGSGPGSVFKLGDKRSGSTFVRKTVVFFSSCGGWRLADGGWQSFSRTLIGG